MALELIDTVAPCFDYQPYTGNPGGYYVYNSGLITPPRQYVETINYLKQFFYDPVEDLYVAFASFSYAFWPSWRFYRIVWDGSDGALNTEYTTGNAALIFSHWTNQVSVGGYDKFYATGNSFLEVKEIDWQAQTWTGWKCYDWAGRNPSVFSHAIVNRTDQIVAGIGSSPMLYIYNYGTQELLGKVAILDHGQYMTYENDQLLWITHASGQLAKVNYQTRRHEMLSRVAGVSADDITYLCAFDTNRKRLAILRHKKDAADGACQMQLEFYNPVPQAQVITAPVPVNSLEAGRQITFAGHVLGDAGEGIASHSVTASLATPTNGQLSAGQVFTGLNGSFSLGYTGPGGSSETLIVETEV
jgi:hypothetical protein